MTIRRTAAAVLAAGILSAATLAAGAAVAQPAVGTSFQAQLNEAKSSTAGSRDTRGTIATHLSAAEALHAQGKEAEAEQYLRFARGMLGLDTVTPNAATQVGERPETGNAAD